MYACCIILLRRNPSLSSNDDEFSQQRHYISIRDHIHRLIQAEQYSSALTEFSTIPACCVTPQILDLYFQLTQKVRVLLKGSKVSFYECNLPDEVEMMRNSPGSSSSSSNGLRSPPKTRQDGNVRAIASSGLVAYTRDYTTLTVRDLQASEILGTLCFDHPFLCDLVIHDMMFASAHLVFVVYHCRSIVMYDNCITASVIVAYDIESMTLSGFVEQSLVVEAMVLEHNNAILRVFFSDGSTLALVLLCSQLSALPDPPTGIIGAWRRLITKSTSSYIPDSASMLIHTITTDEYFEWKDDVHDNLSLQSIHSVPLMKYSWRSHHKLLWVHGPRHCGKSTLLHALRLQMPNIYHCYVCGTSHRSSVMCSYDNSQTDLISHENNFNLIMSLYHQFVALFGDEYRSLAIAQLESCVIQLRAADDSDLDSENLSFAALLLSTLKRVILAGHDAVVAHQDHAILPDLRLLNIEVLFECLLSGPLAHISHHPDDEIVIIIDNIDSIHAVTDDSGIFYILQLLCLSTPEWVRIIFSSVQMYVYTRIFSVVPHQSISVEELWSKDILSPVITRHLQKMAYSDDMDAALEAVLNAVACNVNLVDTIFEYHVHNWADLELRLENINLHRVLLLEHFGDDNSQVREHVYLFLFTLEL